MADTANGVCRSKAIRPPGPRSACGSLTSRAASNWLRAGPLKPHPLFVSKVNTVSQIAFAALVLGSLGLGFRVPMLETIATYAVAVTTLASGAAYVVKWGRRADDMEPRP